MVDGALAAGVAIVGLVLMITGHVWGIAPLLLGLVYGFFVGGRAARWSRLRRDAGI